MTEPEWLTAIATWPLVRFLKDRKTNRSKTGRRRLRLVGCGATRRVTRFLTEQGQKWLNRGEQLADDLLTPQERREAGDGQFGEHNSFPVKEAEYAAWCTLNANAITSASGPAEAAVRAIVSDVIRNGGDPTTAKATEEAAQGALVRCVFGNPFRPVTLGRSWSTPTITNLAQAIYDERQLPSGLFDNQRMGVLADALEEAGCDNADILGHLRGGGDHVRGCWAVDLVLGKL